MLDWFDAKKASSSPPACKNTATIAKKSLPNMENKQMSHKNNAVIPSIHPKHHDY